MAKESFVFQNLFGNTSKVAESPTKKVKLIELFAKKPEPQNIMQGELLRYKKSSKELHIPRWCVLTLSNFLYYKSQFSAICEEKPLFSISLSLISSVRALTNGNEFIIEIVTSDEEITTSPISTKLSVRSTNSLMTEKHLLKKPRYLVKKPLKHTIPAVKAKITPSSVKTLKKPENVRESKNSWTTRENLMYLTEERLIFVVFAKEEWESWQKAFKTIGRLEVCRDY